MLIRPAIAALRNELSSQRRDTMPVTQAIAQWYESPDARQAAADVVQFANGAPLEGLACLSRIYAAGDPLAPMLARGLVARLLDGLERDPLDLVALRHFSDDLTASVMLARSGTATLTLQVVNGPGLARRPAPKSVPFMPGETYDHVLAGCADVDVVRLTTERPGGAVLETAALRLERGMVQYRNGAHETVILRHIPAAMVTLKLQRRNALGGVMREYLLADGSLVHQAAGSSRDSRLELTTALLGRMGRSDAASLLAAMAEEQGADSLRWQSLRECLALDTAAGFATLCMIAARAQDPLAATAGALRAQLIDAYPQLRALTEGNVSCPL